MPMPRLPIPVTPPLLAQLKGLEEAMRLRDTAHLVSKALSLAYYLQAEQSEGCGVWIEYPAKDAQPFRRIRLPMLRDMFARVEPQ